MIDIENILDIITPEALKDNDAIASLLYLFNNDLKKNLPLYQNPNNISDISFINDILENTNDTKELARYKNIKKEVVNTYLKEVIDVLENAQVNEEILAKFDVLSNVTGKEYITEDLVNVFIDRTERDYIHIAKEINQNKGTLSHIEFMYHQLNNLNIQGFEETPLIEVSEQKDEHGEQVPYTYTVNTNFYKVVYDNIMKPLTHPVGFQYIYQKLLSQILEDHVLLKLEYINLSLTLCTGIEFSAENIDWINKKTQNNNRIIEIKWSTGAFFYEKFDIINNSIKSYYVDSNGYKTEYNDCKLTVKYDNIKYTSSIQEKLSDRKDSRICENYPLNYRMAINTFTVGTELTINGYGPEEDSIYTAKLGNYNIGKRDILIGQFVKVYSCDGSSENLLIGNFAMSRHNKKIGKDFDYYKKLKIISEAMIVNYENENGIKDNYYERSSFFIGSDNHIIGELIKDNNYCGTCYELPLYVGNFDVSNNHSVDGKLDNSLYMEEKNKEVIHNNITKEEHDYKYFDRNRCANTTSNLGEEELYIGYEIIETLEFGEIYAIDYNEDFTYGIYDKNNSLIPDGNIGSL